MDARLPSQIRKEPRKSTQKTGNAVDSEASVEWYRSGSPESDQYGDPKVAKSKRRGRRTREEDGGERRRETS